MWLGDFPTGFTTVTCMFTTHDTNGAPVAPSTAFEAADVRCYKNGSATQRTSESGWTMTSPFDSITGLHCLLIDLSDNTDAGFYAAGGLYTLVLSSDETVNSQAVAKVIGQFTIGSGLWPTTASRTLDVDASGGVEVGSFQANSITAAALAADAGTEIADAILDRNMATGTDSGSTTVRTPRQALRAIRNKAEESGGTLTVFKEDDSTASWTAAVTRTSADAISAIDPAGP